MKIKKKENCIQEKAKSVPRGKMKKKKLRETL